MYIYTASTDDSAPDYGTVTEDDGQEIACTLPQTHADYVPGAARKLRSIIWAQRNLRHAEPVPYDYIGRCKHGTPSDDMCEACYREAMQARKLDAQYRAGQSAYNDGCTLGRVFARTHNEAERWAESLRAQRVLLTTHDYTTQRYCEGMLDILDNWLDGQGA